MKKAVKRLYKLGAYFVINGLIRQGYAHSAQQKSRISGFKGVWIPAGCGTRNVVVALPRHQHLNQVNFLHSDPLESLGAYSQTLEWVRFFLKPISSK
jgi:hypothetical protein